MKSKTKITLLLILTFLTLQCADAPDQGSNNSKSDEADNLNSDTSENEPAESDGKGGGDNNNQNLLASNSEKVLLIYGEDSVSIGSKSIVENGLIASNGDINVGEHTEIFSNIFVKKDLNVGDHSIIHGDVYIGGELFLDTNAEIKGNVIEITNEILKPEYPNPEVISSDKNIIVQSGTTIELDSGDYNHVRLMDNATLKLTDTVYHVGALGTVKSSKISLLADSLMTTLNGFRVYGDIQLYSRTAKDKKYKLTLFSPAEKEHLVGANSIFFAHAFVPNGSLKTSANVKVKGKLWGKEVTVGNYNNIAIYPVQCETKPEICGNGADEDCNGFDIPCVETDSDGDGFLESQGDCDDYDATINPGAVEACDLVDNNCDGSIDNDAVNMQAWFEDKDGDGSGVGANSTIACNKPAGHAGNTGDCNDANAEIHPGAAEVCDGFDNNCNNSIDENLAACENGVPIEVPNDPKDVAPDVDEENTTSIYDSTAFIYQGNDPIQKGVGENVIDPKLAAVIRGRVLNKSNAPMIGVDITIHDHPKFGGTKTQMNGYFDMVVNGGKTYVAEIAKQGFLHAQRRINVPILDYANIRDVVLIPFDGNATTIDLSQNQEIKVAEGSIVTDQDGSRRGVIMFPKDTTAKITLQDGTEQPLDTLNVRITEYTVGENGFQTMPATLPANIAYTHAFDVSVDEAQNLNATDVTFNKPLFYYVDNFLNFPTGTTVPMGYYDEKEAKWIASKSGVVAKILNITNNKAVVSINKEETEAGPADLNLIGVTDDELTLLADKYEASKTFWRVPIPHFSTWDANWAFGVPFDAKFPEQPEPKQTDEDKDCNTSGSIIGCENQSLGELLPLTGLPYNLYYQSDRTEENKIFNTVNIQVTGEEIPASLKHIIVEIHLAGRVFEDELPNTPNQKYTFTWDGKNAYGQELKGRQHATIKLGYVYDGAYEETEGFGNNASGSITGSKTRQEVALWQEMSATIGGFTNNGLNIDGWGLDILHSYDPYSKTLYLGDGSKVSAKDANKFLTIVAGNGKIGFGGDGGPALEAEFKDPEGLAIDSKGNIYIGEYARVRKIDTEGIVSTIAGDPGNSGFSPGPINALEAKVYTVEGIFIDDEDNIYFAQKSNHVVSKISPNGILTTVAGTGVWGFSGDGGPAAQAQLKSPTDVVLDDEGNIYIADAGNERIRKISTNGIITTFAGGSKSAMVMPNGDGGYAVGAKIHSGKGDYQPPNLHIAMGSNGLLYIAEYHGGRIRAVTPDGRIDTVAGNGKYSIYPDVLKAQDGGKADEIYLNKPVDVLVNEDDDIYTLFGTVAHAIVKITGENIFRYVAGNLDPTNSTIVEGPALASGLWELKALAKDKVGNIYAISNSRILKIGSPFPGFSGSDIAIPSQDGKELYRFDKNGKHLQTVNAQTGTIIHDFHYDLDGNLISIEDTVGKLTNIERDANGKATAAISPFGVKTKLTVDSNNRLVGIENPKGEAQVFEYSDNGLLTKLTNAKNKSTTFEYNDSGRLVKDTSPTGGFKALTREETNKGYKVNVTTAMNRTTAYSVELLANGDKQRTVTNPSGFSNVELSKNDETSAATYPDGTSVTTALSADPRFGMMSPVLKETTLSTPSGLKNTTQTSRAVTLTEPDNYFSIDTLSETLNTNGNIFTSTYTGLNNSKVYTTPELKTITMGYDNYDRLSKVSITGLTEVDYKYNDDGKLIEKKLGARVFGYDYNSKGFLSKVTTPLQKVYDFEYDLAGRLVKETLPGAKEINYTYDANGNLISVTPPGKTAHTFVFDDTDFEIGYIPPMLDFGDASTAFEYNLDHDLTRITRPDGKQIVYNYDAGGRLDFILTANGMFDYSYDEATGVLKTLSAPGGEVLNFTYDGFLVTESSLSGIVAGGVTRTYNNDFNIVARSVNGANEIAHTYDKDGLKIAAGDLTITRKTENTLIDSTTLGKIATNYSYNSFGELTGLTAKHDGAEVYELSYQRDDLGRVVEKTENIQGVGNTYVYHYDAAGRLFEVIKDGSLSATYTYDDNGNRTAKEDGQGVKTGTVDGIWGQL